MKYLVILAMLLSGCRACDVSGEGPTCHGRPAPYKTDKEWHATLKAQGWGFWDRNQDKPFSIIPVVIEGLSQINQ
jgi:hypothetical protein